LQFNIINVIFVKLNSKSFLFLFARWELVQNFEMLTDRVSLTLDLLNPKSIGFDTMSRTTTVPSFKSFQSRRASFVSSC